VHARNCVRLPTPLSPSIPTSSSCSILDLRASATSGAATSRGPASRRHALYRHSAGEMGNESGKRDRFDSYCLTLALWSTSGIRHPRHRLRRQGQGFGSLSPYAVVAGMDGGRSMPRMAARGNIVMLPVGAGRRGPGRDSCRPHCANRISPSRQEFAAVRLPIAASRDSRMDAAPAPARETRRTAPWRAVRPLEHQCTQG
jgi:hypothetical protein